MKLVSKNLFPELHVNPIHRDLILVTVMGFLIAIALGAFAVMVVGG